MPGTLFVVATPIGNLADLTLRAQRVLQEVDFIACEDTRVTAKLLHHLHIQTPLISYHQHSNSSKMREIESLLLAGKQIALVTDAGTPGISDPGNELIRQLTINNQQLTIAPVPGPSAVTAALSVCGFPTDKFLFLGFPPHKKKRNKFFEEVRDAIHTVAFYESSHRIKKALGELAAIIPDRPMCLCRELTKMHESIYRGTVKQVSEMNVPEKGECVVIIG